MALWNKYQTEWILTKPTVNFFVQNLKFFAVGANSVGPLAPTAKKFKFCIKKYTSEKQWQKIGAKCKFSLQLFYYFELHGL